MTAKIKATGAEICRSLGFGVAAVGSLLMTLNWQALNIVAFIGILVMFVAATVAIIGVALALRDKNGQLIVQNIVIMMWAVLLPLILLVRQVY